MQDLIVKNLAKNEGGTQRRWRIALGPIKVLDGTKHSHCDWSAEPCGLSRENSEIENAIDQLRMDYPILERD